MRPALLILIAPGLALGSPIRVEEAPLAPLPYPEGIEGVFAGTSRGALLAAGGRAGGEPPRFLDAIWAWEREGWRRAGSLSRPLAFGGSIAWRDSLVCAGGTGPQGPSSEAFRLVRRGPETDQIPLPPLPRPLGAPRCVLLGDALLAAQDGKCYRLPLDSPQEGWRELPDWPGPGPDLLAVQNGRAMGIGGDRAWALDQEGWTPLAAPPASLGASLAIPLGHSDVLFLPSGREEAWRYNLVTDRWAPALLEGDPPPPGPRPSAATWEGGFAILEGRGEARLLEFRTPSPAFGWLNWTVLVLYLAAVAAMGALCGGRDRGSEGFFLGRRRIPWWAAGLSIFGTALSAITFLAVPAKAFAADWKLALVNLTVLAAAPLVAFAYLPVLRRGRLTTLYQYLGQRFGQPVRRFSSAVFILFQLGRMGIVLLLPALALSAVAPLPLYACLLAMGVLSTLYTAIGGIRAVVWTDVLQTAILLGGALASLALMGEALWEGWDGLRAQGKLRVADFSLDLGAETILVVLLGGFFTNALVPYTSDQAVVQRYLSTPDLPSARRALWLAAGLTLPATLLFLALGTALYAFYQAQPELLGPLEAPDQIFAWFIVHELPAGLSGLVVAGVFAASMSSLDSSMHSIATTVSTDWRRRGGPDRSMGFARRVVWLAGGFGTLSALAMASLEIAFLWDFFLSMMGLLGSALAGIVAVGVFLPRIGSRQLWPGIWAAAAVLLTLRFLTPVHGLALGFAGVATVVCVAALCGTMERDPARKGREGKAP